MADVGGIAGDRLKSFVERIERLEEEKKTLQADIKEVYAEAKGTGFDTKIMRQLIKIRKMDKDDLDEQETLLDLYKRAIGMAPEDSAKPPSRHRLDKSPAFPCGGAAALGSTRLRDGVRDDATCTRLGAFARPCRFDRGMRARCTRQAGSASRATIPSPTSTRAAPSPGCRSCRSSTAASRTASPGRRIARRSAPSPRRYLPQYGGFCAFGVAGGYKADIDPEAFSLVDGKLYLNYSKSIRAKWLGDVPGYIGKADAEVAGGRQDGQGDQVTLLLPLRSGGRSGGGRQESESSLSPHPALPLPRGREIKTWLGDVPGCVGKADAKWPEVARTER